MIILIWLCYFRVSKGLSLKICQCQNIMFLIQTGFAFELLFRQLVWSWRAKVSDVVIGLALPVKRQTLLDLVLSSIYPLLMFFPGWYSSPPIWLCWFLLDVSPRWRCWWSIAMVDRGCVAWSLVDGPEVGAGDNFSSLCTSSNMGAPTT